MLLPLVLVKPYNKLKNMESLTNLRRHAKSLKVYASRVLGGKSSTLTYNFLKIRKSNKEKMKQSLRFLQNLTIVLKTFVWQTSPGSISLQPLQFCLHLFKPTVILVSLSRNQRKIHGNGIFVLQIGLGLDSNIGIKLETVWFWSKFKCCGCLYLNMVFYDVSL